MRFPIPPPFGIRPRQTRKTGTPSGAMSTYNTPEAPSRLLAHRGPDEESLLPMHALRFVRLAAQAPFASDALSAWAGHTTSN